jgi:DNA ligase (NAD+)
LEGEVAWYCVNSACPAQLIRNVEHFVSREAMDISGVGIKIVEQLVKDGLIEDVADLYFLKRGKLLALEGFAEKKADNILTAIRASKNQPLNRILVALGIRGVGEVVARMLVEKFCSIDALASATISDLQQIEGIGPNIAEAIVDWFARPSNKEVLKKLKAAGISPTHTPKMPSDSREQILSGMTLVITGALPTMTRSEAKELIERLGGKVIEAVSKKTNYLVVGDNPGSKLEKAKELGITILDEKGFRKLIEGSSGQKQSRLF